MATTGLAVYNPRENILDTVIRYAYIETKAFLVRFKEIIIIEVKDAVNDVKSTVKATIYTVKVAITGSNLNFPLLITDGEIPMTQEHEVNSGFGISLPTWFSSLWSASLPSTVPTAKTFTMWQILDLILVLLGLFFLLALLYKGYVKWKKPKAPVSLGVQKDVGHGDMEKNGEVENGKTKTSLPKVLPMLGNELDYTQFTGNHSDVEDASHLSTSHSTTNDDVSAAVAETSIHDNIWAEE